MTARDDASDDATDDAADDGLFIVADQLFTAIERGDLDALTALYADDIVVWANFDNREQNLERSMKVLTWMCANLRDRRYEVKRRERIEGGFLQEHVLHGTAANGAVIAMPACILATVVDGKVTRINEYLDPAAMAPLLA